MRLQIGHEQRGRHSFPANVGDEQPEPPASQIQKVVVVAADVAGLHTGRCAVERCECRCNAREQLGLNLPSRLQLLSRPPLSPYLAVGRIEPDERKTVSVHILETGDDAAPIFPLRRMRESNAAAFPFGELRRNVIADKNSEPALSDEGVFLIAGLRADQRQDGSAVRRSDGHAAAQLVGRIGERTEAELVYVESEALFDVTNKDRESMDS